MTPETKDLLDEFYEINNLISKLSTFFKEEIEGSGIDLVVMEEMRDSIQKEVFKNLMKSSVSSKSTGNVCIMRCDVNGFVIHANRETFFTLRRLQKYIKQDIGDIIGKSIDVFHKDPSHARKIISNPSNLPYRSIIALGEERIELYVTANYDNDGVYNGITSMWSLKEENSISVRTLSSGLSDVKVEGLIKALGIVKTNWDLTASDLDGLLLTKEGFVESLLDNEAIPIINNEEHLNNIIYLISIYNNLISLIERKDDQRSWLYTSNKNFNGDIPVDIIKNDKDGFILIRNYLKSKKEEFDKGLFSDL